MPSSPPPPDGGGGGGGEGEEDLISALPDDVLRLVLLRLPSTAAAARTSVLSRRWCRLWAHLPELRFPCGAGSIARARAALADHDASVLRLLFVEASGADPGHATALLLLAAPRLAGHLFFSNEPTESGPGDGGAVELPCFEKVEEIYLQLGNLALTLPVSGVFADLTVLVLTHVRFHGPCDLGDAISSARCPSLRKLVVRGAQGLSNLTIRSESLIIIDLYRLDGLQELTIVAPMLTVLSVSRCFLGRKPLANISAPAMEIVRWRDAYDSNSVHLGELVCLQILSSSGIFVYGPPGYTGNLNSARLLQHFQKIPIQHLVLSIIYPTEMVNCQYLMDAITLLPCIEILELGLATAGHVFGHSVFHLLRISTSLRNLNLVFLGDFEAQTACSRGCICGEPQDWETEELFLNFLQEVEISGLRGIECELTFLKRLLRWTTVLKTIILTFDSSVTVSEELCKELLGLSCPNTCMKIYLYRDGTKVMYTRSLAG